MATYLLLRNNKESGPFSQQQLQQMGLKPYDLVWVEGRSAAWRYPGEVNELKEFAPNVEEQPFDRFFKKPGENKEKHFYELVEVAAKKEVSQKVNTENSLKEKTYSKIFVSMPTQPFATAPVSAEKKIPVEKKPEVKLNEEQKEESVPLTEKYSQPLEDIKKKYAEIYLNRKQKNNRNEKLKSALKLSAVVFCALAIGIFIYIKLKPAEKNQIVSNANAIPRQNIITETIPRVENSLNSGQENRLSKKELKPATKINEPAPVEKTKKPTEAKNIAEKNEPANETEKINTLQTELEGSRDKSVRDITTNNKIKPVNLASYVSIKANEYKRRSFGGIENLELTVSNSSNFILDKVIVELQYLKPSELPLITERIQFTTISPNGTMTIKIPDNPRGIKVIYKIIQVESGQFDKNTAGL